MQIEEKVNVILYPCPFCGGEARLIDTGDWGTFYGTCNECGAEGAFFEDKQKAIDAWNTRHPDYKGM